MKKLLTLTLGAVLLSSVAFAAPKEIVVDATNWGFASTSAKENIIELKKGETVKLTLNNKDGIHGMQNSDLKLNLRAGANGTASVDFTPTVVGTHRIRCHVSCGSGHNTMEIFIKVTE